MMKFFKKNWMLLVPVGVAFLLRLYKITSSAISHDEGYTIWLIRYNWSEILERTARDVHPPLYYFIAKAWVTIAGDSVFSIRFLSLLFSVGIVYLTFCIIKEIWSEKAAFWAAILVALSPFMVRFGQEARMYGVVAFFTTLAAYYFIKYVKEKDKKWLIGYVIAMIAGMYTQYYAFFAIISFWVILSISTPGFWEFKWKESFKKTGVFDVWWWLANIALLVLYAPWFLVAYAQVARLSDNYWIRPEWITLRTVPNSLLQFISYRHLDGIHSVRYIGPFIYWLVITLVAGSSVYLLRITKNKKIVGSLLIFGFLPMILVYILSELRTPIYQDRYFPFSAVALFAVWGILLSELKSKIIKYGATVIFLGALITGNYTMHQDVNHQMDEVRMIIESQKQPGDIVVSGELYTFLDSSYYLGYKNVKLISEDYDGFGESSLFYDKAEDYLVAKMELVGCSRVWLIGRDKEKEYYEDGLWAQHNSLDFNIEKELRLVLFERSDGNSCSALPKR